MRFAMTRRSMPRAALARILLLSPEADPAFPAILFQPIHSRQHDHRAGRACRGPRMVHDATLALLIVVKSDSSAWWEDRMRWCSCTAISSLWDACLSVQSLRVLDEPEGPLPQLLAFKNTIIGQSDTVRWGIAMRARSQAQSSDRRANSKVGS